MYPDSEILFPPRCIQQLRDLRGPKWQALIRDISLLSSNHEKVLAFGLMMIRQDGCLTCHADSYRAMRGCSLCAQQAVTRFKGSDSELIAAYEQAKKDILRWHLTSELPPSERLPPGIK